MPRSERLAATGTGAVPVAAARDWPGARERELTLDEAERQVLADIGALGWRARHRLLDEAEPTAVQCELRSADGTEIPYGLGSGKGRRAQARVGAHFEALEHAFTGPVVLDALPVRLSGPDDLLAGPLGAERAVRELARQKDARIACLRYRPLDGGEPLDFPLALWAPWYPPPTEAMARERARLGDTADYRPALSYSVNTGCAIGATEDEALLHALNEWAERDAFSLFLLRGVHDGGPLPARIPPEALPASLGERLDRAAALVDGPVVLLDLTTDLGIPVVMAYAPEAAADTAHRYGLGASLSGETAVERAVTELVQGALLARVVAAHDREAALRDRRAGRLTFARVVADHDIADAVRARLAAHPRLLACAHLDFADRLHEAPLTGMPPETVPPGTSVPRQRAAAVERIGSAGHRVLAHTLKELDHGTTVVQVQCPGLERFHLITKGHLALPGPRARRLRRS